jgi:predicted dienelactone hydrolase
LRCADVSCVIDQLEKWNRDSKHACFDRMDLSRIGMSGHSFGAHTAQATTGQSFPIVGQKYVDARIRAMIAFSPSAPKQGASNSAFASVKVPWMLMTGTKDVAPIGGQTVEDRLAVYPSLPKVIDKYELVLDGAEHSAFGDGLKDKRNEHHHPSILALSTAFWDTYLKEDSSAKAWLTGPDARKALQEKDRWQRQLKSNSIE